MKAPDLLPLLKQIIFGLLDAGVQVVSYSCDGTETERVIQRSLSADADSHIEFDIASGRDGIPPHQISIPVFRDQPIVMLQDSKHALKTFRNNLFSGARLLHFGNYAAFYQQVRDMAFEEGTPLYHRDVEKLDRQDDNAASRLFSAPTLHFLADRHPEEVGLIVYLFIFGELCDAYQNRSIGHDERILLALRARIYLCLWERYLDNISDSPKRLYFLSREATDITNFLVDGLISLIVVHRDYIEGSYPLLPWLHSTEACEHVFGLARQVVKDFTMLDFFFMLRKLEVKLREAVFNADHRHQSEFKARAAGYNHTYLDTHDIDLLSLARFPPQNCIISTASKAADEVDSLIALLGIIPSSLHELTPSIPLPAITTWFADEDSDSAETESDCENDAGRLQTTIRDTEGPEVSSDRSDALTSAAIAIAVDEQIRM